MNSKGVQFSKNINVQADIWAMYHVVIYIIHIMILP